jgi:hypothetical protein
MSRFVRTGLGARPLAAFLLAMLVNAALRAQPLPDLTIMDLSVNDDCQIVVTLKNNGPGALPITAYDQFQGPAVAFRKDGAPFGAWRLSAVDAGRRLRPAGGTLTWTRGQLKLSGTATVSVSVDDAHLVAEENENNNSLSKTLSCTPALPDLSITDVTFSPDCRAMVHLRNEGDAPLPASRFVGGGAYLQRYLDGTPGGNVWLGQADPGKATINPGGTYAFTDGVQYRAHTTMRYELHGLGQEKSTANNARQVNVPAGCAVKEEAPKVDLTVTNLTVDEDCRVVVTLKNSGPDELPLTAYDQFQGPALSFKKNGGSFGGWRLIAVDPAGALKRPGGSVTWTRGELKFQGSANVSATVDDANLLAETNEANNTLSKTLSCNPALPDLAITAIAFTRDCRAVVTVRNLGKASLPDGAFAGGAGAYLQRYLDNVPGGSVFLSQVDPGRTLEAPGGTRSFTDGAEYKAKSVVKYQLMRLGQEASTANNVKQANVPPKCHTPSGRTLSPPLPRRPLTLNPGH